ncbi:DNA-processing protein DprA [Lentzea sp. NPDC059081]|uniref:DNA-processing protein DprA n=1 Tax=Lentzea sp. NPDC059081 TaxID=3346719 RepID=UPI00367F4D3F
MFEGPPFLITKPIDTAPATTTTEFTMASNDDIRLARAHLSRVAEVDRDALTTLVTELGPVEASNRVRSGDPGFSGENTVSARDAEDRAHRDLEQITSCQGRLVIPEDPDWPQGELAALSQPKDGLRNLGEPLALWVRGPHNLSDVLGQAIAMVGSRAATGYGEHVASEFAHVLGEQGSTIVSGGGYGIDGAAHRGALGAGAITVAVLACGPELAYPLGHGGLLRRIAREGMIVSEYPPGVAPARHRFLARNRIIAALGAGTVVVEAGRRSGAKYTAETAARLGRVVMAVPGPITSAGSVGCHEMMRTGLAIPVGSTAEVIDSLRGCAVSQVADRTTPGIE